METFSTITRIIMRLYNPVRLRETELVSLSETETEPILHYISLFMALFMAQFCKVSLRFTLYSSELSPITLRFYRSMDFYLNVK